MLSFEYYLLMWNVNIIMIAIKLVIDWHEIISFYERWGKLQKLYWQNRHLKYSLSLVFLFFLDVGFLLTELNSTILISQYDKWLWCRWIDTESGRFIDLLDIHWGIFTILLIFHNKWGKSILYLKVYLLKLTNAFSSEILITI